MFLPERSSVPPASATLLPPLIQPPCFNTAAAESRSGRDSGGNSRQRSGQIRGIAPAPTFAFGPVPNALVLLKLICLGVERPLANVGIGLAKTNVPGPAVLSTGQQPHRKQVCPGGEARPDRKDVAGVVVARDRGVPHTVINNNDSVDARCTVLCAPCPN